MTLERRGARTEQEDKKNNKEEVKKVRGEKTWKQKQMQKFPPCRPAV